ncbi:hypothetical protein [Streptomyces sp. NPDC051567]|uniref:hypothetical protein n=1 Tax=Streptomyces sp. NPDC051567 TaxID=3365660 RepID=UPI0037B07D64
MREVRGAAGVWAVEADGVRLEVPATIAGVREGLAGARRTEFDAEVERTVGNHLDRVLLRWALPPGLLAREGMPERVERGNLDGLVRDEDGVPVDFAEVMEVTEVTEAGEDGTGRAAPPTWGMTTGAGRVRRPATIGAIRAGLDEERRRAFDVEVPHTPGHDLCPTLVRWATPPEVAAASDAAGDRIARGDFTGVVNADGSPFALADHLPPGTPEGAGRR